NFSKLYFNRFSILIACVITISFLANAIMGSDLSSKSVLRLFTFLSLFLLFPFVEGFKILNWVLYFCLIYLLLSQLAYIVGISPLINYFSTFYPYTGELRAYTSDFLSSGSGDIEFVMNRRYGGIYHNPNQLMRYISLLLLIFLIENRSRGFVYKLPFVLLVLFATSIAGSRTGFIFVIIVVLAHFYLDPDFSFSRKVTLIASGVLSLII